MAQMGSIHVLDLSVVGNRCWHLGIIYRSPRPRPDKQGFGVVFHRGVVLNG